jgi:GTP cyclohydrolase I
LPDVQNSEDSRQLPINKVGIKDIRHPFKVLDKSGGVRHTIATFNMYVGLPHNFKGTHMSRFVEILNSHEEEISVESFETMLREMVTRLEAETGHLEMSFPYFINKVGAGIRRQEPDGLRSHLHRRNHRREPLPPDHQGRGAGHQPVPLLEEDLRAWRPQPALARHHHGHHQPAGVDRGPRAHGRNPSLLRALRPAQAARRESVTERAYDNPKFVEDLVRDVAGALNADSRIDAYVVESENFESIHNHSAYALIECNKKRY